MKTREMILKAAAQFFLLLNFYESPHENRAIMISKWEAMV